MYRVIYQFGTTEVASLWTHDTTGEAWNEALAAADDEGLDDAWIEEVPS